MGWGHDRQARSDRRRSVGTVRQPRAAANAARNLDGEGHARLKAALARAEEARDRQDPVELALANIAFRDTWTGAVRNQRLAATISRFADHVQVVRFGT